MAQADGWDPAQYERFAAERAQPFWDLAGLVEDRPLRRAVDLGCGSGDLTAALARRRDIAAMTGIDSSPAMLGAAQEHAGPGVRFLDGDIGSWSSGGDHDLVFANASLQWVPDHPAVVARWWAALRRGGQLAVQIPSNADHPSHRLAGEVASSEPFRSLFDGPPPADQVGANVLAPEQYAILLHHLGAARQHVRLQVYGHVLDRTSDVVEWVKGTTLTRFSKVMAPARFDEFVGEYRRRLLASLGDRAPYFYPFKRILLWGVKP